MMLGKSSTSEDLMSINRSSLKEIWYYIYAFQMQYYFTLAVQVPLILLGWYWISGFWWVAQILDARSRYIEFKKIRSHMSVTKHPERCRDRWLKRQCHAPCRRTATAAAIRDINYANDFYYDLGYRWYHLFPDRFFVRIFSIGYWKAALFKK